MDFLSDYRSEIENLIRLGLIVEKEDGDYALTEMGRLVAIEAERGEMAVN